MKTQNKSQSQSKVPREGLFSEIIRKNDLGSNKVLHQKVFISGGDSRIGRQLLLILYR